MAYPGYITVKEVMQAGIVKSADSQSFFESPWTAASPIRAQAALQAGVMGQKGRKGRNLWRALTTGLGSAAGGAAALGLGHLMGLTRPDNHEGDAGITGLALGLGGLGAYLGHRLGSIGDEREQDNQLVSKESLTKILLGRGALGSFGIPVASTGIGAILGALGGAGIAGLTGANKPAMEGTMAVGGVLGGGAGLLAGAFPLSVAYQKWLDSPEDKKIRKTLTKLYAKQDAKAPSGTESAAAAHADAERKRRLAQRIQELST